MNRDDFSKLKRAALRAYAHFRPLQDHEPYITGEVNHVRVVGLPGQIEDALDLQKTVELLTDKFRKSSEIPQRLRDEVAAHLADKKTSVGKLTLVSTHFPLDNPENISIPYFRYREGAYAEVLGRLPVKPPHKRPGSGAL